MNKLALSVFVSTIILAIFGIFLLYESSTYTAFLHIGDKYHFVKNQMVWLVIGVVVCAVLSRIPYKAWYGFALPMLVGTALLLFAVFIPGIGLELKGSHRWINLGFIVLQPSELLKITLTVYLAAWLSEREMGRLPAFLILLFGAAGLVAIEPDMGTAFVVVFTAIFMYFLSGAPLKQFAIIGVCALVGALVLIKMEPYRVERLLAFQKFNPNNMEHTSYHVKQVAIALGSGGITGVGFGNSIQKYGYVPENTTDSIFAIFAEEAGFIGSTILVLFFAGYLALGFIVSANAPDKFSQLLAAGIVTFIGTQTLINIASQVVLMPLTGVPLPFISYGGSSLVINFASVGILIAIANSIGAMAKAPAKHKFKLRMRPKVRLRR